MFSSSGGCSIVDTCIETDDLKFLSNSSAKLTLTFCYSHSVQENIVILNATTFCVHSEECCNIKFFCQLLHPLRVKVSSSRSKENTEDFEKYLMNVSLKFSEF